MRNARDVHGYLKGGGRVGLSPYEETARQLQANGSGSIRRCRTECQDCCQRKPCPSPASSRRRSERNNEIYFASMRTGQGTRLLSEHARSSAEANIGSAVYAPSHSERRRRRY